MLVSRVQLVPEMICLSIRGNTLADTQAALDNVAFFFSAIGLATEEGAGAVAKEQFKAESVQPFVGNKATHPLMWKFSEDLWMR